MKLKHQKRDGDAVAVTLSGDLEVDACTCLQNFWAQQVERYAEIDVELEDVDDGDAQGMATFAALVEASLRRGSRVTLRHAPQVLAHTFYRVGLLGGDRLTLVEPRLDEEPYGSA